jgi:hypothetical protein
MAGIQDLGNGLGYVYVTDPSSNILSVYENTPETSREIKLEGVKASALSGNRVATAIITVDAPSGNGSITAVTIGGVNAINTGNPFAYTVATTPSEVAKALEGRINEYSTGVASQNFTCIEYGGVLYIFSDASSGTTYNGQTPILVNSGNFTYTVDQDMIGGSSNSESYDESYGYRFYLDADYGATVCSGGGVAVPDSISNAIEITDYIVNKGLQGAFPISAITMSNNGITGVRKGFLSYISLTGQGSADDQLDNIIINGSNNGDMLILISQSNTITVTSSGNINLLATSKSSYNVNGLAVLFVTYLNGQWYELVRSGQLVGTITDYRDSGYGIFALEDYATAAAGTGGTVTFVANTDEKYQKLTGSPTLLGNQTYALDATAEDGDEFWLEYDAATTVGAFALSIFGITLTDNQALKGGLIFYARFLNGAWYSHVFPNFSDANSNPFVVYSDLIETGAVTLAKLETTLKEELITTDVSFETGEVGDMKIKIPFACTVNEIYASVSKAIAATDNATIVPKDNGAVAMTAGTVTLTASSGIGTGFTSTPTANNTFTAGQIMTLTTAKTTAGGKAKVSIKVTRA